MMQYSVKALAGPSSAVITGLASSQGALSTTIAQSVAHFSHHCSPASPHCYLTGTQQTPWMRKNGTLRTIACLLLQTLTPLNQREGRASGITGHSALMPTSQSTKLFCTATNSECITRSQRAQFFKPITIHTVPYQDSKFPPPPPASHHTPPLC